MITFFSQTVHCLDLSSPEEKCKAVVELWQAVQGGDFEFDPHTPVLPIGTAGRPDRPELVAPSKLRRRRLGSEEETQTLKSIPVTHRQRRLQKNLNIQPQ